MQCAECVDSQSDRDYVQGVASRDYLGYLPCIVVE